MRTISGILNNTANRSYPLPEKPWKYYQEWNDVLFLHWSFPVDEVRKMLPAGLTPDTFGGKAYLSFVAFTVSDLGYRQIPAPPYFSSFKEINFRTYVVKDGIPGIYMFSIETNKWPVALLTRLFLGMRYSTSDIYRTGRKFESGNTALGFASEFTYKPKEPIANKGALDRWLTERHALYEPEGSKLYRFDIHHREWQLQELSIKIRNLQYHKGPFHTVGNPVELCHFSKNVKVLLWAKKQV